MDQSSIPCHNGGPCIMETITISNSCCRSRWWGLCLKSRMIDGKHQNTHEICTDITSRDYRNHTCSRPCTLRPFHHCRPISRLSLSWCSLSVYCLQLLFHWQTFAGLDTLSTLYVALARIMTMQCRHIELMKFSVDWLVIHFQILCGISITCISPTKSFMRAYGHPATWSV